MPVRQRPIRGWEPLTDAATGELAAAMPISSLPGTSSVKVEESELCFRAGLDRVIPPRSLLERFVEARNDAALVRFAKRFGPLRPPDDWFSLDSAYREPLDTWRLHRWHFNYLLSLAAALRENASIDDDPYAALQARGIAVRRLGTLSDMARREPAPWSERTIPQRRSLASSVLLERAESLVRYCKLRPALTTVGSPELAFDIVFQDGEQRFGISLLGALTVQFIAAVTGSGFAVCSGCGEVFVPKRRQPAFGKRRYCQECGRGAALKAAKAAYRIREREKRPAGRKGSK